MSNTATARSMLCMNETMACPLRSKAFASRPRPSSCMWNMFFLFLFVLQLGVSTGIPPTTYIDIGGLFGPPLTLQRELAVQVCAGFRNRSPEKYGAVYTFSSDHAQLDLQWLVSTGNNDTVVNKDTVTNATDFIRDCLQTYGYIRYSWSQQKVIVPNLVTLAAVLDGVPLEDDDVEFFDIPKDKLMLDALKQFPPSLTSDIANAPRVVTKWVFQNYANQTTGMSKMNPGLDVHGPDKWDPPLTQNPKLGLVDYIVKARYFNFFLNLGCVRLTDDHALMEHMVEHNTNWPRPIVVLGYDDTIAAAGDIFEAETKCVREHNMGQVASDGVSNLSFFSSRQAISTPLLQVPNPDTMKKPYNASQTYLMVIMGDGDNLNFVKETRRAWMLQRLAACKTGNCFPLVWSLSPAALYLAPDYIRWYYNQSFTTKNDWFVLPPSGHTYSYPSEMPSFDQQAFVNATNKDAWYMNSSGTVAWEWFGSWGNAIERYFPRYAGGTIQACFAVNVPYLFPIREFGKGEHFKILPGQTQEEVVLFAPREWRGSDPSDFNPFTRHFKLSPADMAAEVNAYPKGTVTHIYATSDGGFNFKQLAQMVAHLDDHVVMVGANELTLRAKQRDEYVAANGVDTDIM